MLQHLKEKKDVGFFTSVAGLMQQCWCVVVVIVVVVVDTVRLIDWSVSIFQNFRPSMGKSL